MRMPIIAAAFVIAAPLPAAAQDVAPDAQELTERLSDPELQERMAQMAGILAETLMDMPVGPMVEAMAEVSDDIERPDIAPDARVRDLVGPDADGATAEIAEKLPQMLDAMAGMAGAMETMMPHLREMAARLSQELPTDMRSE